MACRTGFSLGGLWHCEGQGSKSRMRAADHDPMRELLIDGIDEGYLCKAWHGPTLRGAPRRPPRTGAVASRAGTPQHLGAGRALCLLEIRRAAPPDRRRPRHIRPAGKTTRWPSSSSTPGSIPMPSGDWRLRLSTRRAPQPCVARVAWIDATREGPRRSGRGVRQLPRIPRRRQPACPPRTAVGARAADRLGDRQRPQEDEHRRGGTGGRPQGEEMVAIVVRPTFAVR